MGRTKKVLFAVSGVLLVVVVGAVVFASSNRVAPVGWRAFGDVNLHDGVALSGFDPLAYHNNGQALAGSSDHTHEHDGVTYRFATEDNKQLFAAAPERFVPRLGGFCAFAVSRGFTADVDPSAFVLEDDQLYLFADTQVRDDWLAERSEGVVAQTERLWSEE